MSTASDVAAWRQVAVTTAHAALAEAIFEQHGAAAITALDAGGPPTVEPSPHAQLRFGVTRTVGLFPLATPVDTIRRDLLQVLGTDMVIEVNDLANQDWTHAWIAHHPPVHFGGRLWVAPHGAQVDTQATDAVVVRLDPGLAFGTGTHPTTALCLGWLAHADLSGCTLLDYGCGSGILAIAAALLGADRVCAVDIDDQAVRATRDNAAANGVAELIETPPIDAVGTEPYDVVLANILARPLVALAPTLTALTRPGGWLLLSGLLQRQTATVRAAYADHFEFTAAAQQEDWMRLDGTKKTTDYD